MANLIITIISISLVAVAALMGAYYGGTAFLQGQAKANATRVIKDAEQIAAAWRLWVIDNGGSRRDFTDTNWGDGTTDLTPQYLTSQVRYPNDITGSWSDDTWRPHRLNTWANSFTSIADGLGLGLDPTQWEVCRQITKMARGPNAEPAETPSNSNFTPTNGVFDCYFSDVGDTNDTFDSDDNIRVVYKVF